jgi:hypothetical protein
LRKLFLVLMVALALSAPMVAAISVEDARSGLGAAFTALSRAESAGGNVGELVLKLSSAAALIDKGGEVNLETADQIIKNVTSQASDIEVAGAQRIQYRFIAVGVALTVLTAAGLLIWFKGSRMFWVAWLRLKKGWRVERV